MASEEYKRLLVRVAIAVLRAIWEWLVYTKDGREEKKAEREAQNAPRRFWE